MAIYSQIFNSGQSGVVLDADGATALIRLGLPGERFYHLSIDRLLALDSAICEIKKNTIFSKLIITGGTSGIFCSGYDIDYINEVGDENKAIEYAEQGQRVLALISSLPFHTIAAINGTCLGGGLELAFSCRYRLALSHAAVKIGFPEIRLGIMPAFGLVQTLTQSIDIEPALDVLLTGKVYDAEEAKTTAIVDEIIKVADDLNIISSFERKVKDYAYDSLKTKKSKFNFKHWIARKTSLGKKFQYAKIKKTVSESNKGRSETPVRIVDTIFAGMNGGRQAGLTHEAKAFAQTVTGRECKSLLHLYFMSELAAKIGRSARNELENKKIGIVGIGDRGAFLAKGLALAGFQVIVVDTNERVRDTVKKDLENIAKRRGVETNRYTQRLSLGEKIEELSGAAIVFDMVQDDYELKKFVLGRIIAVTNSETIIVTSTAMFPVHILSEEMKGQNRFVGLNLVRPIERSQLVEIIRSGDSSARAIAYAASLMTAVNKYPVVVSDVPGFLAYRLIVPVFAEAAQIISEGHHIEVVDEVLRQFGFETGPFGLIDQIGLDIYSKLQSMLEESYGPRMAGPHYVDELLKNKRAGFKNRKGFYLYEASQAYVDGEVVSLLKLDWMGQKTEVEDIKDRLTFSMMNEAVRALDEQVAGDGGPESAGQIDLASVMGVGFPSNHGGVIYYADSLGAQAVMTKLNYLMAKYGERFAPVKGIKIRSEKNLSFYQRINEG